VKINEVIAEAVNTNTGTPQGKPSLMQKAGNFVKKAVSGVKGAAQGYQASQQQRQGTQATQQQAKTWIEKWNQAVGSDPTIKNNPQALQNYAKKLARDMRGRPLFTPDMPTDMSPMGVNRYITSVVGKTLTGGLSQTPANVSTPTTPTTPLTPATDIKDTLELGTQYRFPNPEFPGTQIIVRNSGWYLDRLPRELRGKVSIDKTTKLYPILQTARIQKYNLYYNQAAESGKIKEEPASML
jgi:hypothetical protein